MYNCFAVTYRLVMYKNLFVYIKFINWVLDRKYNVFHMDDSSSTKWLIVRIIRNLCHFILHSSTITMLSVLKVMSSFFVQNATFCCEWRTRDTASRWVDIWRSPTSTCAESRTSQPTEVVAWSDWVLHLQEYKTAKFKETYPASIRVYFYYQNNV